jgi:hypothetical protein
LRSGLQNPGPGQLAELKYVLKSIEISDDLQERPQEKGACPVRYQRSDRDKAERTRWDHARRGDKLSRRPSMETPPLERREARVPKKAGPSVRGAEAVDKARWGEECAVDKSARRPLGNHSKGFGRTYVGGQDHQGEVQDVGACVYEVVGGIVGCQEEAFGTAVDEEGMGCGPQEQREEDFGAPSRSVIALIRRGWGRHVSHIFIIASHPG